MFNTRGKITNKESKELKRTHANIFDENESIKEKERFEEKENSEENEPMEVEIVEKEERLERVSRRKLTWLTNKLCKDIITDIVNSMETAVTTSMMEKLLEEVANKAVEDGNMNIIVKDVEEYGQAFRNRVEEPLKSRRRTEEAIMRALVEDGEREQRIEEVGRRKLSGQEDSGRWSLTG